MKWTFLPLTRPCIQSTIVVYVTTFACTCYAHTCANEENKLNSDEIINSLFFAVYTSQNWMCVQSGAASREERIVFCVFSVVVYGIFFLHILRLHRALLCMSVIFHAWNIYTYSLHLAHNRMSSFSRMNALEHCIVCATKHWNEIAVAFMRYALHCMLIRLWQ